MSSITISFLMFLALVDENFRLSWMDSKSHFFCTSLEFAQHFLSCSFEDANRSTSSGNLMFVRQS